MPKSRFADLQRLVIKGRSNWNCSVSCLDSVARPASLQARMENFAMVAFRLILQCLIKPKRDDWMGKSKVSRVGGLVFKGVTTVLAKNQSINAKSRLIKSVEPSPTSPISSFLGD